MTDSEVERARLAASAAAARRDLARVEAATAPAREQLAAATGRADQARWQHTDAQRRLDTTGWRGRRAARHELAAAEVRRQRAVEHLQRTRHRTRPDIDQYNQARARVERGTHGPRSPRHPGSAPPHSRPGPGPATTGRSPRAVESMGPRRHHQRPATRRHHRTAHQPQSPRRARRPVPSTRPSGTRLGRRRWHRPADQGATHPNPRASRTRTWTVTAVNVSLVQVAPDPRASGRGSPDRPEAGGWPETGLADRLRGTKSARVVPRVPSIQPESGDRPGPRDEAGGCGAEGLSSDVRYHQPANRQSPPYNDTASRRHPARASAARDNAESGRCPKTGQSRRSPA